MDRSSRKRDKGRGAATGELAARVPLHTVLVAVLVVQALLAVGLVGYLSIRNARGAVNEVAHQLRAEVTTRIEERLQQFLETPHHLNQVNADLFSSGALNPDDPDALARHFWEQILASPSVTSVYYGNTRGGIANAGREGPEGALYTILTDGFSAGTFRKFALDTSGHRLEQLQAVPNFDARTRGWYTNALAADAPTWSAIYLLFSGQDMAISASRPAYDPSGVLLGVVSSDIFLSQLSGFLRSLKIGMNGQSFIIERSGLLVASAADASLITQGDDGQGARRLSARESASPVVRAAAAAIGQADSDSPTSEESEFAVGGERHFLQVLPVTDGRGIEWLVVVAIPERDFMAPVDANTRSTLALVAAAALIAMTFGIVMARTVTRPMRSLGLAAQALARGEWREVEVKSRIVEIAGVSGSFNSMARQLQETVGSLETEVVERRRAEEELRASEARYRLLADNSADVIWTIDMDNQFTYVSPSVEKLRGYTPDEVMREPLAAALTPGSRKIVDETLSGFRDRLALGLPLLPAEDLELEQPCKDGTTVWTETVASPLFDAEGKPFAILGVSRNITARKRAEQERSALEAQLRQAQKLESIGTLASGIAHEINNPLTGIINYAELIERRVDDAQLREYAKGIMSEGNRVAEIVRGLLSFARQESSERQATRIPDVLRAALTLVGSALRRDQIRLEEESARDLPSVRCNPQQVEQILINLLTNARDALNRKYPGHDADKIVRIHIHSLTQDGKAWVRTTVEDHGVGVPPELATRIFDPFFTTKPRDAGTGLGLSISYGIAREHGGELSVESEEGRTTRFHLDLPAE